MISLLGSPFIPPPTLSLKTETWDITATNHIQITDWPSSVEDGIVVYRKESLWMSHCLWCCQSVKTEVQSRRKGILPPLSSFPFQYIWLQWWLIQRLLWEWEGVHGHNSLYINHDRNKIVSVSIIIKIKQSVSIKIKIMGFPFFYILSSI